MEQIMVKLEINEEKLMKGLKSLKGKGLLTTDNVIELAAKCTEVKSL
jgi:hypothetical protein